MEIGLSASHQPVLLDSSRRELGDVLEINMWFSSAGDQLKAVTGAKYGQNSFPCMFEGKTTSFSFDVQTLFFSSKGYQYGKLLADTSNCFKGKKRSFLQRLTGWRIT